MNNQEYHEESPRGLGIDSIKEPASSEQIEPLLQEFRRYSTEWFQRITHVLEKGEAKRAVYEVFCELFEKLNRTNEWSNDVRLRLRLFIFANLHQGIMLQDIAEFLGYSPKYSSELFKAQMGEPFSCYLKRLRLEKAQSLLKDSDSSLSEIAEALGFQNAFAFSHFFKKAMGCSPAQFRKNMRFTKRSM